MSLNYAFGFSLFLLSLVGLNIYFFYTLKSPGRHVTSNVNLDLNPNLISRVKRVSLEGNILNDIYEYLKYLPSQYRQRNSKFLPIQRDLTNSFNATYFSNTKNVWDETKAWSSDQSLFPYSNGSSGRILQSLQTSQITVVDNAPKGTQLKLLLLLEGKHKVFFKPKRYLLDHKIHGSIYAGFDRHNSEVFGYYLAMILGFRWVAPATLRKLHIERDIIAFATPGLKKTMKMISGKKCIYGKCFYCKVNETVCPDYNGEIEGAAILYYDKQFTVHRSPWIRSYNSRKMEWETDNDFCKKVTTSHETKRILNLVDVAIFDFLIQNGDRHRYEVYKEKIVLLDNGKGLGNPDIDEMDILAPLYQCCIISSSTWSRLEVITGGSLTDTLIILSAMHHDTLATEQHFTAVERRLLKVFATVQYCIGKYGSAKVIKGDWQKWTQNVYLTVHN